MPNKLSYTKSEIGLEVVILSNGDAYCTQSSYARFSGKDQSTISKRASELNCVELTQDQLAGEKAAMNEFMTGLIKSQIFTGNQLHTVVLIPAKIFGVWIVRDMPELAEAVLEAGAKAFLYKAAGYEIKAEAPKQAPIPEMEDPFDAPGLSEQAKYVTAIKWLQESGDIQLAQVMKSHLGNIVLKSNQQMLTGTSTVGQYEGAVDVAIRLGFSVPKNYESSLGKFVKKFCSDLIVGQNNRYSTASHKQVPANMYPARNHRVEVAVREFCVERGLTRRDISHLED